MKFTYLGHACFQINIEPYTIIFDPFIRLNELAASINFDSLKADFIIITHAHFDHIADAIDLAKQSDATIISNWEICNWANKNGISKSHSMNIGGSWDFPFGTVKVIYACHSSSFEDGSYGGTACGFVIQHKNGCFYYSGDTSLNSDMQLIPKMCAPLDFAVLPIGNNYTMGYKDASIASSMIETKKVIGVHYDTFGYIKIDKQAAKNHFTKNHQELILMNIGESIQTN